MSLQLPNSVVSHEDLKSTIMEIQAYSRWFAAASIKQRVSPTAAVPNPPPLSPASLAIITDLSRAQSLSAQSLEAILGELQTIETKSPTIIITLAAPAAGGLRKTLTDWCRAHIAPTALVSFKFNSTILGGMVMQYGSHVYDWSFRRQILTNRDHFPEVLRRV